MHEYPKQPCIAVIPTALATSLFWCGFYQLVRYLLPKQDPEFCNRLVTLFHGLTISFCGLNQCFAGEFDAKHQNAKQSYMLAYSLGYFIFDLAWSAKYQTETKLMIGHHIVSVISLYRVLSKNYPGTQSACALGAMEVSNPILQLRWFLRTFGYHHTPIFSVVELFFMFLFIVVRIFYGTAFLLNVLLYPQNPFEFKMYCILIYTISWLFLWSMVKYVNTKYVKETVMQRLNDDMVTDSVSRSSR